MVDDAPAEGLDVAVDAVPDDELPVPEVNELNGVDVAYLRAELLSIRKLLVD